MFAHASARTFSQELVLQILFVAVGWAIGAVLRYFTSLMVIAVAGESWPFGTLVVNLFGSFLIGFLWQVFDTITFSQTRGCSFLLAGWALSLHSPLLAWKA